MNLRKYVSNRMNKDIFDLDIRTNPSVKLRKAGNGFFIYDYNVYKSGIIFPEKDLWTVLANGHEFKIGPIPRIKARDAAWLLMAWLDVEGTRRINESNIYPVPSNSDMLHKYILLCSAGIPREIPDLNPQEGRASKYKPEFRRNASIITSNTGEFFVKRTDDELVICEHWCVKRQQLPAARSRMRGSFPALFPSEMEAIQALLAVDRGWSGMGWA